MHLTVRTALLIAVSAAALSGCEGRKVVIAHDLPDLSASIIPQPQTITVVRPMTDADRPTPAKPVECVKSWTATGIAEVGGTRLTRFCVDADGREYLTDLGPAPNSSESRPQGKPKR